MIKYYHSNIIFRIWNTWNFKVSFCIIKILKTAKFRKLWIVNLTIIFPNWNTWNFQVSALSKFWKLHNYIWVLKSTQNSIIFPNWNFWVFALSKFCCWVELYKQSLLTNPALRKLQKHQKIKTYKISCLTTQCEQC